MNVKKLIVIAAASLGVLALRRLGPALCERAMAKCQEMLDRMSNDFPPKRMRRGTDEIEIPEWNARNRGVPLKKPEAVAVASERR